MRAPRSASVTGQDKASRRSRSRSHRAGLRKRVSFNELPYSGDQQKETVHHDTVKKLKSNGEGMTIWWIALVCLTMFFRFEATVRREVLKMDVESSVLETTLEWLIRTSKGDTPAEILLTLLRGVSCVTGLAVGVGYYTFKVCFRFVQGSMSRQLYEHHNVDMVMSYPCFCILDSSTHIGAVCTVAYYWSKHVTPAAACLSFVLHRLWSITFSRGTSLFYDRVDLVYGFKEPMPTWSFVALYGSELLVIYLSIVSSM